MLGSLGPKKIAGIMPKAKRQGWRSAEDLWVDVTKEKGWRSAEDPYYAYLNSLTVGMDRHGRKKKMNSYRIVLHDSSV